jgi:hypothetical protein
MTITNWAAKIMTVRNRTGCGHIEAVSLLHDWISFKWITENATCDDVINLIDQLDRDFVDDQVKNSAK